MLKSITLRSFPQSMDWKDCFKEAHLSGYDGVELNFDGRFNLNCSTAILKSIKKLAKNNSIKIVSVYSRQQWQTPISSSNPEKREKGIMAINRLIEIASYLEAEIVLVIPGTVDNSVLSSEVEITPYDEVYRRALDILRKLAINSEKKGVVLALENVPNKFLLSPLEMEKFIEEVDSTAVGSYFDIANCLYLGGYPEQWIRILNKHIKAIHLKDYKLAIGNLEGFTNIFEGDVNWKEVCKALAEIGYDYSLTSEVLPVFKYHPEHLWKSVSIAIKLLEEDIKKYQNSL